MGAADIARSRTSAEVVQQELPPTLANLDIGLDLAVRAAQQQTGAAAAALALTQDKLLICRARVGSVAPSIGVRLNESVGITGACVRTGEVLYCSDAETDLRVDSFFFRESNIRSILVVPILEGKVVTGVVEVFSPQAHAFDTTHIRWLMELAQFIQALTVSTMSQAPQPIALVPAKSVPQAMEEGAETEQPKKAADGPVSRQEDSEETELAVIRGALNSVGNATWDEISHELESRFGIHENGETRSTITSAGVQSRIDSAPDERRQSG